MTTHRWQRHFDTPLTSILGSLIDQEKSKLAAINRLPPVVGGWGLRGTGGWSVR